MDQELKNQYPLTSGGFRYACESWKKKTY